MMLATHFGHKTIAQVLVTRAKANLNLQDEVRADIVRTLQVSGGC